MKQMYIFLFIQAMFLFLIPDSAISQEARTGTTKKHVASSLKSPFSVDQSYTVEQLIQNVFVGDCFEVFNISAIGSLQGIGHFSGGEGSIGFSEGVILSTGAVMDATGPNFLGSTTTDFDKPGDSDLNKIATGTVKDATGIEFDFIVPPTVETIAFQYVFASEEYNEYVCSAYNDVFGFFISGPGYAGPFSNGGENIALVPGTNMAVSINTINNGSPGANGSPAYCESLDYSNLFVSNILGTAIEYDGFTTVLTAVADVIPCQTYHIRLLIGDVKDGNYDSAVFLKANGFTAGGTATVAAQFPYFVSANNAYECCSDGAFRFERNSGTDVNQPLVVPFTIGGTATNGVDYDFLPNSVTIPPGQMYYDLPISVVCDGISEGPESIVLTLEFPCLCENQSLTLTLNDGAGLEASLDDLSLCKGADSTLIPTVTGGVPGLNYLWSNNTTDLELPVTAQEGFFVFTVTDACGNTAADTAFIHVLPEPQVTILTTDVDCPGAANGMAEALTSNEVAVLQYQWSNGAQGKTLQNLPGGSYSVTVTNANGCKGEAIASIAEPPPLELAINTTDITCFGDADGRIQISAIEGGTPPYELSMNNAALSPAGVNDLAAGSYLITLLDGHDCLVQKAAIINEPPPIQLDLGADLHIELGEWVQIQPMLNVPPASLVRYIWEPAICENCLDTILTPLENMHLKLTVTDTLGCTASSTQSILVKKSRKVYVPNAFSPNNDGINDLLTVFSDASVQKISLFEIFNRWGGKVFSTSNFLPNNPAYGWDGKQERTSFDENIFTWKLVVQYIDGKTELLTGDVLLVK